MATTMDKIIDIHNHILPGVDDGARTIEESIDIINYLGDVGIKDLVITSHYIDETKYNINVKERNKLLRKLKKLIPTDINIYLGNEVFLTDRIIELLNDKSISTLNNSKYILVEFPLTNLLNNYGNIFCNLTEKNIVPIIAHPERYSFIQKDKNKIYEFLDYNILLQINIESLIGKYGKESKKIAKWLLKKNLVSFVATDSHRVGNVKELKKAYKKLKRIVGKDKYNELTYTNPKKVIENKEIKIKLV